MKSFNHLPSPHRLLNAWLPFKELVGFSAIHTKTEYRRAMALIDLLLNKIGDDEDHPLAEVLNFFAEQVRVYEQHHVKLPDAAPAEVLRFLLEQHDLTQDDLAECASQSRISEILNGRRTVSKDIAKKLAHRFNVHADLFI